MCVKHSGRKIAFCTLGCKVNQYESDCMMDSLKAEGWELVSFSSVADVYVVNTCAVTNMAERKSRQMLHRARKKNPNALLVAVGCYVQERPPELFSSDVDIFIGNNRKKDIGAILADCLESRGKRSVVADIDRETEYEEMTLVLPKERCRAYVKVQDGCNNFCSYCIIPYTRGRIRSRGISDTVREVEGLAGRGIREVVLTGINLSSYQDGEQGLLELTKRVAEISGIERIRFGSLEPRVITEAFLAGICALPKVCPHFHLSLQSACNETLRRMNRKYTIETYMEKCELIRRYYDRPAIATDLIVGFPEETEEEFATTVENLKKLSLYEIHVFKYSRREGTVAAAMPNQVEDEVKDRRSDVILALTAEQKTAYEAGFAGEEQTVLVESYEERDGHFFYKGHTDRYILVSREATEEVCKGLVNTLVSVTL